MTKLKNKRSTKGKRSLWRLPWFVWLAIVLVIVGVVVVTRIIPSGTPPVSDNSSELNAAIIDQLYAYHPNPDFIEQATQQLEDYGFKVTLYQGSEVDVELYEKLPLKNYQLIVFRVHSGTLQGEMFGDPIAKQGTYLFTNERYSKTSYISEQLTDQVLRAKIAEGYPEVFAIGAKFLSQSMQGRFNDTIIIMMGCSTTYSTDLSQAFINRGASVYMGWDGAVVLDYVDEATLLLIDYLNQGMTIEEAVDGVTADIGPDPEYNAYLRLYPVDKGNKTITELMH